MAVSPPIFTNWCDLCLISVQAYASLYLNSALNPIIYAFRSPSFREGYKEILCQTPTYVISDGKFVSFSLPLSLSLSTTSSGSSGTLRTQVWSTPDRKWWPAAGIISRNSYVLDCPATLYFTWETYSRWNTILLWNFVFAVSLCICLFPAVVWSWEILGGNVWDLREYCRALQPLQVHEAANRYRRDIETSTPQLRLSVSFD